jgi:sec-independent protein translocase protein TatA
MDLFAPWHLLIILLIVLVIFGPRKLGEVGSVLGKAVRDFKKVVNDADNVEKPAEKAIDPAASNRPESNPVKLP